MGAPNFIWLVLLASALVAGAAFVGLLVVRPHAEIVLAVLGAGGFALSSYALFALVSILERFDALIYGGAILIGGLACGWALAASLLDRLAGLPSAAMLVSEPDTTRSKVAVIVLSCSEPPRYDPRAAAAVLRELAEEELVDPSVGTLPFMYFAQKARYRAIGGTSPAAAELTAVADALQTRLASASISLVTTAMCAGEKRLAKRIAEAVAAGNGTIVVAELTVADSPHSSLAKREADILHLGPRGVEVLYTGAIGPSERVVGMLERRVMATVADPETTGVVLVGHGQPASRAKRFPAADEEETAFLSRVRMRLLDAGVPERNVRIAWAEWRTPDVPSALRHLAALGCRRVIVLPAVFPLDSIGTRLDLELAVRQARIDESTTVVTLPAWHDDDSVIEEIACRVDAALEAGTT